MTDALTDLDVTSIRKFVQSAADEGYLSGRVLDYGAGRQPYREIVETAGGKYHGYDRAEFPCNRAGDVGEDSLLERTDWDAILCTGILQFLPQGFWFAPNLFHNMRPGSILVLTYTTNWPEVNEEDFHRFTRAGMEKLWTDMDFSILRHERRATIHALGYEWATGY